MFAVWQFDDSSYQGSSSNAENDPTPSLVFQDEGNTLSNGNLVGSNISDTTGQLPGETTRRDSHGAAATLDSKYVHVVDRIQNVMEVFDTTTFERFTYDLTTKSGATDDLEKGVCFDNSVTDDSDLPLNDPAPDLFEITPDGQYFMIAFRGPAPVSVPHGAQGSCPGVGIVKISDDGKSGTLVDVLRTTNQVTDNLTEFAAPGGATYTGSERSDVHGCIVVAKQESQGGGFGSIPVIGPIFNFLFALIKSLLDFLIFWN